MPYSIKKLKEFKGTGGVGYNLDLYRNGRKIAEVIDEGGGGEVNICWLDRQAPLVAINIINRGGEQHSCQGTPEQKLFVELANSQTYTYYGHTGRKDAGILLEDIIESHRLKKDCKKKTVVKLVRDGEDSYTVIRTPYTPETRAWLTQKYGDQIVEIVNERPEMGVQP